MQGASIVDRSTKLGLHYEPMDNGHKRKAEKDSGSDGRCESHHFGSFPVSKQKARALWCSIIENDDILYSYSMQHGRRLGLIYPDMMISRDEVMDDG
jgi:hypothetical protein